MKGEAVMFASEGDKMLEKEIGEFGVFEVEQGAARGVESLIAEKSGFGDDKGSSEDGGLVGFGRITGFLS